MSKIGTCDIRSVVKRQVNSKINKSVTRNKLG